MSIMKVNTPAIEDGFAIVEPADEAVKKDERSLFVRNRIGRCHKFLRE